LITKASLHQVAAACLKACENILSSFNAAKNLATSLRESHTQGLALQDVSKDLQTVSVAELQARLEQLSKDEGKAAAAQDYLAADRIKKERLALQKDVELFAAFNKHVMQVHKCASEAQGPLSQAVRSVEEIQKRLAGSDSLIKATESGLKEVVKIAGAIMELTRDEFAWMAGSLGVEQLLSCTSHVQVGLRGTTETLKLGPILANLNQLLAQVQSNCKRDCYTVLAQGAPRAAESLQRPPASTNMLTGLPLSRAHSSNCSSGTVHALIADGLRASHLR
jgi:hypothetical protein